jgi:hypothetical protein
MFNRTLRRPMFRRGGKAEGGITSGLKRQGYATNEDNLVIQNDQTKVQEVGQNMEQFNKAFPSYNSAGSDFFMNLGSNILSAPGGNPILQTLGTAAKAPLLQMQKTNMANTQGNRELALKFWNNLDDDDKILVEKQMDFYMSKDGGNMSREKALEQIMFRKSQSPTDAAREAILTEEGNVDDAVKKIGQQYELGQPDASTLYKFFEDIQSGTYEGAPHHPGTFFIEDDDVARSGKDSRLVIQNYDPKQQQDYKDGRVYIDFITKIAYVKQGQFFVPYSEWSAEEISTN